MSEINGLVFTKEDNNTYSVFDLSYAIPLGNIVKEEGPGWILLINLGLTFLDWGQLNTIADFIKDLK